MIFLRLSCNRKTMNQSGSFFLCFITLLAFLATYTALTSVTHLSYKRYEKERFMARKEMRFADNVDPLIRMPTELRMQNKGKKRLFHTALTATDAPYNRWQCRIMYYWFKHFRDLPGSEMGGFTRVLHSGKPDSLMDEIPTFVVDPLPAGSDRGYVVLNRPWAFVQWLSKASIEEDYILMAEPDHVIVKPLPNLATEDLPAAFPFFYIAPKEHEKVLRKYFPEEKGPITNINPIGNSPVMIRKSQLEKVAPTWVNVSLAMKGDEEADKAFGWVLEMYGYALASALHDIQHSLRKDFMIQPPWDLAVAEKFIIHYTYGCDYAMNGSLTYGRRGEWRFDKRSFSQGAPPRNLPLPPPGVPESVVTLVKMVNEATANIPNWKAGE